jgi:hypothetical protein
MRITKLAVVAAGLTLGLAACSSSGSSGSATPGPSGSTGSSTGAASGNTVNGANGGVANSCVVGSWRTTGTNATFDSNGAQGTVSGGSGVLLKIAHDGKAVVDFGSMQPVTFSTAISGTEIKGSFLYGGKATGQVQVDDGMATKGTWKPVGTADWRDVAVTVDLASPVQSRIVDKVKIADFATAGTDQTGGTVDIQPILREGTYECTASTLTVGPPSGVTGVGTWSMTRA